MKKIIVIGAGVGGLSAAAVLARAGLDVTVLEAHVYPGGTAGTFFHKGYRFDAGATLSGGFYPGGPMDRLAKAAGIESWPVLPEMDDPTMVVHLPDGRSVPRWGDDRRHVARRLAFGQAGIDFFDWQEKTADLMWSLALRMPPWPPQDAAQLTSLTRTTAGWLREQLGNLSPDLILDTFRPAAARLQGAPAALKAFVDAQLLISAQTTSDTANALYAASALDLPRRGVVHLDGGMGAIADTLVAAVRKGGGSVHFRQEVSKIRYESGRPIAVETKRGDSFDADLVIANLTPWNIAQLADEHAPAKLRRLPEQPDGWGAFIVYAGIDAAVVPKTGLHHQVISGKGMGEGGTIFVSISPPEGKTDRAPAGRRAVTISTHTDLKTWWDLFENDRDSYETRKEAYLDRVLAAAETAVPGLRGATDLVLPGTPVSFQRFTRRAAGWVGGFPQTSLFRTWAPRLGPGLWMVGDSIFPGQSTAAVALGGLRVAEGALAGLGAARAPERAVQLPVLDLHAGSQKPR